jgi:hypothetical protein
MATFDTVGSLFQNGNAYLLSHETSRNTAIAAIQRAARPPTRPVTGKGREPDKQQAGERNGIRSAQAGHGSMKILRLCSSQIRTILSATNLNPTAALSHRPERHLRA